MHNQVTIPPHHPRAESLRTRELLVDGFSRGLVSAEGLIAHGRGEAFDYLIRERTTAPARRAIRAAAALLLVSKRPVVSVNGNAAALCPMQIVELSNITGAAIEVNLFYRTSEREIAIKSALELHGAKRVLGVGSRASARIPELQSERRRVDPEGILIADTVLVPLEDGDRAEALVKMGKRVIAIDLNPLSRTARTSQITIVDNIVRAMPALVQTARSLKGGSSLKKILAAFDNNKNLRHSIKLIKGGV